MRIYTHEEVERYLRQAMIIGMSAGISCCQGQPDGQPTTPQISDVWRDVIKETVGVRMVTQVRG